MRIFWCDAIDTCLFQVLLSTNYSIWFLCELCVNEEEEEEGAGIPLILRERGREGSPEIFLLVICFRPQKAEKNKKFS